MSFLFVFRIFFLVFLTSIESEHLIWTFSFRLNKRHRCLEYQQSKVQELMAASICLSFSVTKLCWMDYFHTILENSCWLHTFWTINQYDWIYLPQSNNYRVFQCKHCHHVPVNSLNGLYLSKSFSPWELMVTEGY